MTTVSGIHISVWRGAADVSDVLHLREEIEKQASPCALLLVVQPDTPLSTPGARSEAAKLVRELQSKIVAIAVAVEGRGFWNSGVRAMFTGISLVAQPAAPWRVFDDPAPAASWLVSRVGGRVGDPPDVGALVLTVDRLRSDRSVA